MKITFLSVRAKNFLQIGNEFEQFDLNKHKFTVIVGKNGSGKSTILDMITYALYKKPYRPKVKLSQLINSTNKKQMVVEIAFKIGNSVYVVRRGEKPKLFEIYKDKKLLEADPSIGDQQDYLENVILGQNYKTFCQINVIGKAKYVQFMNLDPADRRAVVEDILDTNVYSVMKKIAKDDLKNLNEENRDLASKIEVLESKIATTESMLARYQADRTEQINDLENLKQKRLEQIQKDRETISQLKKRVDELEAEKEKILPANHVSKLEETLQHVNTSLGSCQSDYRRAKAIVEKIDSMTECPHCMQNVDDRHKQKILEENQSIINDAEVKIKNLEAKRTQMLEIRNRYQQTQNEIDALTRKAYDLNQNIKSAKSYIESLDEQIAKLKQPVEGAQNLPDVEDMKNKLDTYIKDKDALVQKIAKLNAAIDLLGDDGIKAKLIDRYIPIINESVNNYLDQMELFAEFNLDSEFNESINAINRETFTYHSFSEGQKMRIDLAILLTWRKIAQLRNSMTTNIFILDEVADGSLDDAGMTDFLNILRNLSDAQNTFLISHKESTQDMFENVIRVETVGNFSKYIRE